MKAPGILGTIQLAGTLLFAIPIGLFGLEKLLAGELVFGGSFLAIAVLMVVVQQYATTPADVPVGLAERVTGAVVKDETDEK